MKRYFKWVPPWGWGWEPSCRQSMGPSSSRSVRKLPFFFFFFLQTEEIKSMTSSHPLLWQNCVDIPAFDLLSKGLAAAKLRATLLCQIYDVTSLHSWLPASLSSDVKWSQNELPVLHSKQKSIFTTSPSGLIEIYTSNSTQSHHLIVLSASPRTDQEYNVGYDIMWLYLSQHRHREVSKQGRQRPCFHTGSTVGQRDVTSAPLGDWRAIMGFELQEVTRTLM